MNYEDVEKTINEFFEELEKVKQQHIDIEV